MQKGVKLFYFRTYGPRGFCGIVLSVSLANYGQINYGIVL